MRRPPRTWSPRRSRRRPFGLSKDYLRLVGLATTFTFLLVLAWIDEPDGNAAPTRAVSQTDAYYPNCAAARSLGAAPLYAGDPGYREQLDRDGDGVACEPYRGY